MPHVHKTVDTMPAFVIHYAGCQYCQPKYNNFHSKQRCVREFLKRYKVANDQAMQLLGQGGSIDMEGVLQDVDQFYGVVEDGE